MDEIYTRPSAAGRLITGRVIDINYARLRVVRTLCLDLIRADVPNGFGAD